jgi:carnitine O-acetyltransferase
MVASDASAAKTPASPVAAWRPPTDAESATYRHQTALPKLPIPDLEGTCKRFLASVQALQTPEEHEQTKRSVAAFLTSDGPRLHAQLLDYEKDKDSFIEDFWYEA